MGHSSLTQSTLLSTCIIYLHQHCPKGSVLGRDRCFSWDGGRESLGGPCTGTGSPLSKWPPNPRGKSSGGPRCPETACPTVSSGLQEVAMQPKNQSQGGNATKAKGTMPRERATPAPMLPLAAPLVQEGGGCVSRHLGPPPPTPTASGLGRTWCQAKWRTGLGHAMELLSPTPNHHLARVEGGTAGPLHLCYTQNIPKEELSQQFLLTRWDKSSPGGSRSHLVGFKAEERTPHHGWTWAWRVHEQHDPPDQAYNRQPHSTNTSD